MILGIGIDIIEVARIASSYEKFGERFVNRILHADEIAYCLSHKNPAPFLAARFAAKEAISKAFGTGIGAALGWQDMEIRTQGIRRAVRGFARQGEKIIQVPPREATARQPEPHGKLRGGNGGFGKMTRSPKSAVRSPRSKKRQVFSTLDFGLWTLGFFV